MVINQAWAEQACLRTGLNSLIGYVSELGWRPEAGVKSSGEVRKQMLGVLSFLLFW